jgi:polyketide synthase PksL
VNGLDFDWSKLHGDEKPRRLSLPTYPFARERYWIEMTAVPSGQETSTAALHPLLHANTSDFTAQRYSSTFTGDESFLADHRVRTEGRMVERVLPAAAYLEMARAAVERSSPARPEAAVLELRQLVWLQPVVVTESKHVSIRLAASEGEEIEYEVYSQDGNEQIVHFRGRASWGSPPAPPPLDLDRIRRQIGPGQVEADEVYAAFVRRGFVQGPAFRVITVLHQGHDQLLAYLRLPDAAESPSGDYVLHPSLMDGALQACAGLLDGWSETVERSRLPFALEQLWVLRPCRRAMAAWVRYAPDVQVSDKVRALDIDLSDESGNVCVEMRGLTSRVLGTRGERQEPTTVAPFDGVFYRQLMADISSGKVTLEEAVELG